MSVVRAGNRRSLAFTVALAMLLALVVPFAGIALAGHTATSTTAAHDIEVTPETGSNATGDDHTLTATDVGGNCGSTNGCEVDFEIESGPNVTVLDEGPTGGAGAEGRTESGDNSGTDPDMSCTITTNNGTCTVSFESTTAGTNVIRAWVDDDSNDSTIDTDRDNTEGRDEATAAGQASEPDDTDVVSKTWFTNITNATLNCDPETATNPNTGTGSTETYTCTAYTETDNDEVQEAGENALAGVTIDGENLNGANDPDNDATGGAASTADYGCVTDANGQCTIDVAASEAQAGPANICFWVDADNDSIFNSGSGGFNDGGGCGEGQPTVDGDETDVVTKTWAAVGVAANLTLTPENDQNVIGTSHTVTATVTDFFGNPVQGVNVDFDIAALSRNAGIGVEGADRLTNAQGQATFTYTDSNAAVTGSFDEDTINAWADVQTENDADDGAQEPNDSASKFWFTALPTVATVEVDFDLTDAAGACEEGTAAETTASNEVATTHEFCVDVEDAQGNDIPGATVTLTSSGVGQFWTDADGDSVVDDGELSDTTTVTSDNAGDAKAFIYSEATGTQTVTATSGSASDTGTKTWTTPNTEARNLDCEPETATNAPGTEHVITCTATDRYGNPVNLQGIQGTETGPGRFTSNAFQTTGTDGTAEFVVSTTVGETGTQTVSFEINEDVGDADDSTDLGDPCDQPAGTTIAAEPGTAGTGQADAPAGNCEEQVTKTWTTVEPEPEPEPLTRGACSGFAPGSRTARSSGGFVIVGTPGDDVLDGSGGADLICGLGGNDIIAGRGAGDLITGNGGDDNIKGGGGKDNISGNRGNDSISGSRGNDAIKGNAGNDTLKGNAGIDSLSGGDGADSLQGGDGDDILKGGPGNDTLRGGDGNDLLDGGDGNDGCFGNAGDDKVKNCE